MEAGRETGDRRRRIPFAAILLIILGMVLLLNTTEVVGWGIWWQLFHFWPVALIAIGFHLILAPRFPLLSALAVTLILVAGIGAAYLSDRNTEPGYLVGDSYHSRALSDIETLEMEIDFGAGSLAVDSGVPPNGDELFTVRSTGIRAAVNPAPSRMSAQGGIGYSPIRMDGNAAVTISPEDPSDLRGAHKSGRDIDIDLWGLFQRLGDIDWDVGISPDVAEVMLYIGAGAADIDLLLSDLNVKTLDLDMGAADVYMELPANARHTQVYIDAGAADIDIAVPDGVAALINSDSGLISLDVDTSRFPKTGGVWQSPNYATAENRVEINIDAGASSVSIH